MNPRPYPLVVCHTSRSMGDNREYRSSQWMKSGNSNRCRWLLSASDSCARHHSHSSQGCASHVPAQSAQVTHTGPPGALGVCLMGNGTVHPWNPCTTGANMIPFVIHRYVLAYVVCGVIPAMWTGNRNHQRTFTRSISTSNPSISVSSET